LKDGLEMETLKKVELLDGKTKKKNSAKSRDTEIVVVAKENQKT